MLTEIMLDVKKRNMSIHKWLVSGNIEQSQQHSSCHAITSDHHPLPIAQNHAWRDHSALSPIAVLANSRSSAQSTEWDTRPTEMIASDETLPSSSRQNIHGSYRKSVQKPHDVRLNAKSTLEKLKFSHIGQELPPISTIAAIKIVKTPNQLIQMLQLATHKLNELHGTNGKQTRMLRLYNLSDFNCYSMGVISSAPSISELALCMNITSATLKKWFTIYKNALMRDFDFNELGNEKIKDHYSAFYPENERYRLTHLGERAIEQYFQQVGKQVFEDTENARETSRGLTNRGDLTELDGFTRSYNIVDEAVKTGQVPSVLDSDKMGGIRFSETRRHKNARRVPSAILHAGNEDQLLGTTSPFNRYFWINAACLAKIQSKHDEYAKIQLDSVPKRLKAGSKDRMLCMVLDCEKHTQAQCNGCCSSHFRMLSSTTAPTKGKDKKVSLVQSIDCISFVPEVASATLLQCILCLI
jgi:hypothetical protein